MVLLESTGRMIGIFVVVTSLMAFGMGTALGGHAANNSTQQVSDSVVELETVDEDLSSRLRENTTGVQQDITLAFAKPIAELAIESSIVGVHIGYTIPWAAPALSIVSGLLAVAIVVGLLVRYLSVLNLVV